MATITRPSTPSFRSAVPRLQKAVSIDRSDFTYSQKVYNYPGRVVIVEYVYPPMTGATFAAWVDFLDDLEGGINTFNEDLTDMFPGTNFAGRTSVPMRLVEGSVEWTMSVESHYYLSFTAIEALAT
jgi:hypothetical protein